MTQTMGRLPAVAAMAASILAAGTVARAQTTFGGRASCAENRSTRQLLTGTVGDFRRLPSTGTAGILALGGAAALGAHAIDRSVNNSVSSQSSGPFRAGATIGGTPLELGAAFTTYAIGRSLKKSCIAALGGDLVQAQLMAEVLTIGLKRATRRARPEGSGFSFPSGHTTMAFASATVLQRHFGWKVGGPAYAVASYIAASRVEMKRHYLSDVAFGAAVGIVAGRTIGVGHGRQLLLMPIASPHGAGASFTVIGAK
jgi:membrane-associated phospholipid phosphatase